MNHLQLISTFYIVDNFCKSFVPEYNKTLLETSKKKRIRTDCLSESEIITILLWFNSSGMNCFKHFYEHCYISLSSYFPELPCYERFVTIQKKAIIVMIAFLKHLTSLSERTGIYYIDSTPIQVCRNQRIPRHKTFKNMAQRGKTSMGWFYGFKLHVVTNNKGQITAFKLSTGNVDDRKPVIEMIKSLKGLMFGDRGYLGKELKKLLEELGIDLITKQKKKMKEIKMTETNKFLLSKRGIIETVFSKMKDYLHLAYTKYRSWPNFFMNILSCLICYSINPNKPKINLNRISMA
jgi:hypothetical protein